MARVRPPLIGGRSLPSRRVLAHSHSSFTQSTLPIGSPLPIAVDAVHRFAGVRYLAAGTVFAEPWVYGGKFSLIGDAAHAFTPFFGQGCNSGFEDVSVLHELLLAGRPRPPATADGVGGPPGGSAATELALAPDWPAVLAAFYAARKPNTDAIARMALENFEEMMAKVGDARFLLEKEIEIALTRAHPAVYTSRYALITHSLLPYRLCQQVRGAGSTGRARACSL
jgi:hypothetical protein